MPTRCLTQQVSTHLVPSMVRSRTFLEGVRHSLSLVVESRPQHLSMCPWGLSWRRSVKCCRTRVARWGCSSLHPAGSRLSGRGQWRCGWVLREVGGRAPVVARLARFMRATSRIHLAIGYVSAISRQLRVKVEPESTCRPRCTGGSDLAGAFAISALKGWHGSLVELGAA